MLQGIQHFLKRFQVLTPPEGVAKRMVVEQVERVCGIALTEKQVRIQGTVAYIQANSVLRNELMLRKGEILRRIREQLLSGQAAPVTEIR